MLTSDERILVTHTGSLPRPEGLAAFHGRRSRGEAIDDAAFERAVEAATQQVVAAQLEAGIDIGNDGEQGPESFVTYVQHRMSGFGGSAGIGDIAPSVVWEKLRALKAGADLASARLYG
jgi:5-methyltetrahydropteroyltriglutamate--homocysteine methyltransferase